MANIQLSEGDFAISWIEEFVCHPPGPYYGQPLVLEYWQKDFLREALRYREDGSYVYSSILFGGPRDIAKSTMGAALSLLKLSPDLGIATPRICAAANDRSQARIIWGHGKEIIAASPGLAQMYQSNANMIWCEENGGQWVRISAEGKTSLGFGYDFQARDEIAYWTTAKQLLLAESLDTALIKRPNAQALNVATAGTTKRSVLGGIFDELMKNPARELVDGLTVVRDEVGGYLMWWYSAPDDVDIKNERARRKASRMACPASWITDNKIEAQYRNPGISEDKFRRQHWNQWTTGKTSWFPMGMWESRGSDQKIPSGARIQVAVDASKNRDSTAVAWAWYDDSTGKVVLRARVWTAVPGDPHHFFFPNGEIDLRVVKDWILKELAEQEDGSGYVITEIAYDPQFMNTVAQDLAELHYTMVEIAAGTTPYDQAAQAFYLGVVEDTLTHDNDKVVNLHVNDTAARQTDTGWKIRKLHNSAHIDATVALYLAFSRAKFDGKRRNLNYVYSRRKLEEITAAQAAGSEVSGD